MSEHKLLICLQKNLTVSLLFYLWLDFGRYYFGRYLAWEVWDLNQTECTTQKPFLWCTDCLNSLAPQITTAVRDRLSQLERPAGLFILIVMINPWEIMFGKHWWLFMLWSCWWFRLCFCVSLRFGPVVSVSVMCLLASAALRHQIAAFMSSMNAFVPIMSLVSVLMSDFGNMHTQHINGQFFKLIKTHKKTFIDSS